MISTHILDLQTGQPASGVTVVLSKKSGSQWTELKSEPTNSDGRISFQVPIDSGVYVLNFKIEEYVKKQKLAPFFLDTQVQFQITDTNRKYHVPLLLSPYGYSTYRGS
jgi:5-hydroxyisourate hydrolase